MVADPSTVAMSAVITCGDGVALADTPGASSD
jgi:hypothetical protein